MKVRTHCGGCSLHCFPLSISSLAPPHTHILFFFDPDAGSVSLAKGGEKGKEKEEELKLKGSEVVK
jgi:hypothetical protein